jgi:TRAP-type mannitol/chloroaromatic compound transport system substrate-binding protein
MQTGTIDAVEWVGPYNDLAFGFQQVAKYYYYPGWHEPGSMLEFTINLDAWNSFATSSSIDCHGSSQGSESRFIG